MVKNLAERAQKAKAPVENYTPKRFSMRLSRELSEFLTWLRYEGIDASKFTRLLWESTEEHKKFEKIKKKISRE